MNNLVGFVRLVIASFCLLMVETGWTETETVNGIVWNYTISGGGAELGRYAIPQSTSGHVDIPAKLGGHPVTRIGAYAFWCCHALTSIKLPQSLKSIGEGALGNCGIQHLELPSKDVQIGKACFMCSGLRELPTNLSMIPEGAFDSCYNLKSIVIPPTVREIGDLAFACSSVSDVVISPGVEKIGYGAFYNQLGVTHLKSVQIPSSVKVIGDRAFANCWELESVSIPEGVEIIGEIAFSSCRALRKISIPSSVSSLGIGAFEYCTGLADVVINAKIDSLEHGSEIFACCTSLKSVTLPETLKKIDNLAWGPFYNCWIEDIYFQGGVPAVSGDFSGINGHYIRKYAAEWQNAIDPRTKMWHGLKMSAPTYSITYNSNGGSGSVERQECEFGSDGVLVDDGGNLHWEKHCFWGWAFAPHGEIAYKAGDYVKEPTEGETVTLYAKWSDCVVHFNANGGVFKGKDGREVKEFDQYFVYGEPQKLFTDDLVPMRMDGSGNRFLGWVRGTPEITSSDDLIDAGKVWTWNDDVTEEWFYAVWTTTLTVNFYNVEELVSHTKLLSPASLDDHLTWGISVDGKYKVLKSGESIEVSPGRHAVTFDVDDGYQWLARQFEVTDYYVPGMYDKDSRILQLDISNNGDVLFAGTRQVKRAVNVSVSPSEETGRVLFSCQPEIKDSLKGRIKREEVPFKESKVHIAIRRATIDDSGKLVVDQTAAPLTDVRPNELYSFPRGFYYITSVTYDADQKSGDPYWDYVVKDKYAAQTFEVGENLLDFCLNFDLFGEYDAVKVDLDPRKGECERSSVWFVKNFLSGALINGKTLPRPKRDAYEFEGWFMADGKTKIEEDAEFNPLLKDDCTLYAHWKTKVTEDWLLLFPELAARAKGDVETAASLIAANGCRTVGECYELGINPEDPNDDFKIIGFEMKDGKPVISLNHTKDGSGNSFVQHVKTLGKANLSEESWREVPEDGDAALRFFKVTVESP